MNEFLNENRKASRYEKKTSIYFDFAYDVQTKMAFKEDSSKREKNRRYEGVTKNISSQGLCFASSKLLTPGEKLFLEILLPGDEQSIPMQAEVKWSEEVFHKGRHDKIFDTGVKVFKLREEMVPDTVYFDEDYKVEWSLLLESVLGKYRIISQEKNNRH